MKKAWLILRAFLLFVLLSAVVFSWVTGDTTLKDDFVPLLLLVLIADTSVIKLALEDIVKSGDKEE